MKKVNRKILIEEKELTKLESLSEINEAAIKEVLNEIIKEQITKLYNNITDLKDISDKYYKWWMQDRDSLNLKHSENIGLRQRIRDLENNNLKYKINIFLRIIFGFALASLIFYKQWIT